MLAPAEPACALAAARTEEEREAVREAWEDVEAGRLIPHEKVRRRLLGGT